MIYAFNNVEDRQKAINDVINTFKMDENKGFTYSCVYNGYLAITVHEQLTKSEKYALEFFTFGCSISHENEAKAIVEDLKAFKEICEKYNGEEY